jgi:hypothetical protein
MMVPIFPMVFPNFTYSATALVSAYLQYLVCIIYNLSTVMLYFAIFYSAVKLKIEDLGQIFVPRRPFGPFRYLKLGFGAQLRLISS